MKRITIILLLVALVSTAFAQHPKKAVKAYEAAEEAFQKRDYQKAHQQLLKAVVEDPNYAEAWAAITLARLYDMRGSYKREMVLLRWYLSKGFNNAPNNATANDLLAKATFRDWAVCHPVAFEPENLGVGVNSNNDEYVNMLSFDGSQLLFTRKMPMGNGYQKEFLFTSQWDGEQWSEPQQLAFADFPEDVDPTSTQERHSSPPMARSFI